MEGGSTARWLTGRHVPLAKAFPLFSPEDLGPSLDPAVDLSKEGGLAKLDDERRRIPISPGVEFFFGEEYARDDRGEGPG